MIDLWMHFLCNMARFLAPKIIEKPKNTDSKRHHKIDQFWDRFFIDFCCVLEAKLDPCWPPFSAQDGPRGLQDGFKTVSRRLQDDPKSAPRSNTTWADGVPLFWSPLGLDFGTSRPRFWCLRAWILNAFLFKLDPFLDGFGTEF